MRLLCSCGAVRARPPSRKSGDRPIAARATLSKLLRSGIVSRGLCLPRLVAILEARKQTLQPIERGLQVRLALRAREKTVRLEALVQCVFLPEGVQALELASHFSEVQPHQTPLESFFLGEHGARNANFHVPPWRLSLGGSGVMLQATSAGVQCRALRRRVSAACVDRRSPDNFCLFFSLALSLGRLSHTRNAGWPQQSALVPTNSAHSKSWTHVDNIAATMYWPGGQCHLLRAGNSAWASGWTGILWLRIECR